MRAWWGRGNANIEHNDATLLRVVGHGVGALEGLINLGHKFPEVQPVPVAAKPFFDVKILKRVLIRGAENLDVPSGAEIDIFILGKLEDQFLDEGRHIVVGADGTFPFLDPEHLIGNHDLHVLLDRHLTGETVALTRFTLVDVRGFCRQNGPTPFEDLYPTHPAGPAATAGRTNKNLGVAKDTE